MSAAGDVEQDFATLADLFATETDELLQQDIVEAHQIGIPSSPRRYR